ncbi:hypothetical protein BDV19DRAFT_328794 [Aspergillus venezuelensis]
MNQPLCYSAKSHSLTWSVIISPGRSPCASPPKPRKRGSLNQNRPNNRIPVTVSPYGSEMWVTQEPPDPIMTPPCSRNTIFGASPAMWLLGDLASLANLRGAARSPPAFDLGPNNLWWHGLCNNGRNSGWPVLAMRWVPTAHVRQTVCLCSTESVPFPVLPSFVLRRQLFS